MTTRFGAYEILYELKSGGMGAVLLGRRRGPGAFEQLVAIKTIRPEYAQAPAVRAMFLDEAAILARLNHPGIATVHDFGEEGGTLYMVMEYVAGLPLRDLGEHVMPAAIIARAIAEAGRGLNAAHEARDPSGTLMGLVHRDISPDNLMLGYDGHIKVIDFGIALVKNRQAPVTEFGTVKGKPPYMSPEQVKNEPMDRRSDVWALGVVAWELLTGKALFDGDSIYAVALAVEQQELVPPSRAGGRSLPTGLDAAVMGALQRDVAQRTPTAAALSEALEQVIQAAGGETLAAWAERELEDQRVQHRAWLASVTAVPTGGALPRATSRPTGQATQIGPVNAPPLGAYAAVAEAVASVPPPGVVAEPSPGTSIGRELELDDDVAPPNRRGVLLLLVLALLIGGIAVYFVFHTTDRGPMLPPEVADAAVGSDAALIVQPGPIDAAPIEIDAEVVLVDAGGRTVARHHDAGVKLVPHDATPMIAPPTGTGTVSIRFSGDTYSNVTLDGEQVTPPINKRKIAAGRHVIKFFNPKTSELLDTQAIEIKDGEHLDVRQRER
ncbi:MAG: serine/threonine-protein kinase [Kofleriaceae bacterium]